MFVICYKKEIYASCFDKANLAEWISLIGFLLLILNSFSFPAHLFSRHKMLTGSKMQVLKCEMCNFTTNRKGRFRDHLKSHQKRPRHPLSSVRQDVRVKEELIRSRHERPQTKDAEMLFLQLFDGYHKRA